MIKNDLSNLSHRDKFFFAVPPLFPKWPYPSRYAIAMKFADCTYIKAPFFTFEIKGVVYQIARKKALRLGKKFLFPSGPLPNLIPKEEFTIVSTAPVRVPVYDFDNKTNTAFVKQ